jgi:hypothetical protein
VILSDSCDQTLKLSDELQFVDLLDLTQVECYHCQRQTEVRRTLDWTNFAVVRWCA